MPISALHKAGQHGREVAAARGLARISYAAKEHSMPISPIDMIKK
jgi:hypothetical protein